MATNILSSIMNSASEGASSAMRSAGAALPQPRQQKDPEQEAFKQILETYAKAGDIEAISRMQPHAEKFGMGNLIPALVDAMGGQERLDQVVTQKKQNQAVTQGVLGFLSGSLGLSQPAAAPSTTLPDVQPAGAGSAPAPVGPPVALLPPGAQSEPQRVTLPDASTESTQLKPITTAKPVGRLKPRYTLSTVNVDPRTGEISNIQLTDSSNKTAMSLQDAVDQGALTQDDANTAYSVNQLLYVNGLMEDPNNKPVTKFMTDRKGNSFMQVGFPKTGESMVIPAAGAKTAGERTLAEGGGMGGSYNLSPDETKALNTAVAEKRLDPNRVNSRTGKLFAAMEMASPGLDFSGISNEILENRTAARQREGVRSASLQGASQLYDVNAPELIKLRRVVAAKSALPKGVRTFNSVDQWAREETGDPDVAEFKGKVLLLSEALQRTFASGQGGEWAFELAKTLIDSTLPEEAFERRLKTHQKDLHAMVAQYKTLGKTQVQFEELLNSLGERAKNYETKAGLTPKEPAKGAKNQAEIDAEAEHIINLMRGGK